ncbi:complement factor H-like [Cheilinus undulatus]|uniref:complement factor H-like n=1 Tax=Cheilinus undulatus TaxID=241271 RepID=UPI001BD65FDA|nr:complement factor H-like [Cheilinus undulatus]
MHVIIRSCVLFLWIHALTFVRSQDCTLQQFLESSFFDENFDTSSLEASYPGGRQVRVSCNVGFSGFFKLICVEGKWQKRGTKCEPRSCGHPGDAQFADFHLEKGDDFVFGSQVVYTCQKGYQMVSRSNSRRCMAEGWDGVIPVCEAQRCPVIHVNNTVQVIGDPEEATFGNVLRFSCKSNKDVLVGETEIYCDENGDWSAQAPTCQEIKCSVSEIQHGRVTGDIRDYKEDEILHYECNRKYNKQTDRPSKCVKIGTSAEFSPAPVCEPTKCTLSLSRITGTTYDTTKNRFSPDETVRVRCSDAYWISTPQTTSIVSTCTESGEWDILPVCQEVRCRAEGEPLVYSWSIYWRQVIRLGDTVRYQCYRGYRPTSIEARCTRDGWSPNPLCKALTCNRFEVRHADIVENNKQIYEYGDKVRYSCQEGYDGVFTLTCQEHNRWSGNPVCTEKGCTRIDIRHAYISYNNRRNYDHNDQVGYTCETDRDRSFRVTCNKGNWTGIQNCQACGKAIIPNGFFVAQDADKLYYTCNEGFKLPFKGWWGEAKCVNREWTGIEDCIENSRCDDSLEIPNAEVSVTNLRNKQVALVRCNDGYNAQLQDVRLSCAEGNWNFQGLVPEAICQPTSRPCPPPPKVENAVILTPYQKEYLSDSEVTYSCRNTYQMNGDGRIRCNDGQWEQKLMSCISDIEE